MAGMESLARSWQAAHCGRSRRTTRTPERARTQPRAPNNPSAKLTKGQLTSDPFPMASPITVKEGAHDMQDSAPITATTNPPYQDPFRSHEFPDDPDHMIYRPQEKQPGDDNHCGTPWSATDRRYGKDGREPAEPRKAARFCSLHAFGNRRQRSGTGTRASNQFPGRRKSPTVPTTQRERRRLTGPET
jgi:hypothetical protein